MEKVVLSNGQEFELVVNGVSEGNPLSLSFLPQEYGVEQLMTIFSGNDTIKVVDTNGTSLHVFRNYTICNEMTRVNHYHDYDAYVCPVCKQEVPAESTVCPHCSAEYEHPDTVEHYVDMCVAKLTIPDINDRMDDAEDAIEDIIETILG